MRRLILLAAMTGAALMLGCTLPHYTESQIARWHGYTEAQRVPEAEKGRVAETRCYQGPHDAEPRCFWVSMEGRGDYEITEER